MPGSGESDNLDERIAAAFGDGVHSTDVETLIKAAEAASVSANERAERARTHALDPALSATAVTAARRAMEDAAFQRDRLQVAVTKLRERLIAVKADEEDARRLLVYDRVKAERDQIADELRDFYPGVAARLADLLAASSPTIAKSSTSMLTPCRATMAGCWVPSWWRAASIASANTL